MIISHIPKQRELHILPLYQKLTHEEIEKIAKTQGLLEFIMTEHQTFKLINGKFVFDYYNYVIKY